MFSSNRENIIEEFLVAVLSLASRVSAPEEDDRQDDFSLFSVIIAVLSLYVLYYLLFVVKKPTIYSSEELKQFLLSHCPILQESYWPTIWCMEARLQTTLSCVLFSSPNVKYKREILELSDGGELGLDWATDDDDSRQNHDDDTRPVIIILTGVTGNSKEVYVQNLVKQCTSLRYRCVVMNYRGLGGVAFKTPRSYSATKTIEDLHEAIENVERKYPCCPIMALGISLGGILITNYLAEKGKSSRLVAGMCVSSPFNLFTTTHCLRQGINQYIFNIYICDCFKEILKRNEAMFKDVCDLDHVYKSKVIADFQERFTVPVFGYKDLNEYYTDCTTDYKLHNIKVPLFCLLAEDDPFFPGQYLPIDKVTQSSNVILMTTPRGGHIAFFDGFLLPSGLWDTVGYVERVFSQFSAAVFSHWNKTGSNSSLAKTSSCQPISTYSQLIQKLLSNQNDFSGDLVPSRIRL